MRNALSPCLLQNRVGVLTVTDQLVPFNGDPLAGVGPILGVDCGIHFFHIGIYREDAGSYCRLLVVFATHPWSELGEIVFRTQLVMLCLL